MLDWMWTGSAQKSRAEGQRLVNFLKSPFFSKDDIQDFDLDVETERLDRHFATSSSHDGWKEASVTIAVPDGKEHDSEEDAARFNVSGLWYRPLASAIKAGIEKAAPNTFHYTPFKQFWKRSADAAPERVRDEIYSSDAMVEAYTELQNQPRVTGCMLERIIVPLMFWSDSTHLASFGDAALWPLYLFFGNQSKNLRVKPSSNMCHHVAYFPKLPASFSKFYLELTGKPPSSEMLTHARRELMHAIWRLLLDDEFLDAYKNGIVCMCEDGIERRCYPRLFTYSADYPEKILLATLRSLGACPCPRCMVPKELIPELGTINDMKRRERLARVDDEHRQDRISRVRKWIYSWAYGIKAKAVERFLQPQSETPTSNAFSDRLAKFGLNPFRMLVPDFMHEFELGVFKSFFIHLLRILAAHNPLLLVELDLRFRLVPTFGRWTVRKFPESVSSLKKLAAWNYECILVCAIPVIDGLLPEPYNSEVLDVLFILAEWHALAKLRMHTDTSMDMLRASTKELGRLLRRFRDHVCPFFATKELPTEERARERAQARKKGKSKDTHRNRKTMMAKNVSTTKKDYNLFTYKLHALGDYIASILWFGTSDSYSTQPTFRANFEHRRAKRFYARTSKNRAVGQIARLERRERGLTNLISPTQHALLAMRRSKPTPNRQPRKTLKSEDMAYTSPEQHYHIAASKSNPIALGSWLPEHRGDPATQNFLPRLHDHLLGRLREPELTEQPASFTDADRRQVIIRNDRIYEHKVFRVNYTTYDVRRAQDSLNPRYHSDIMTLSPENDMTHPFQYAQIIGVYHADVIHNVPGANAAAKRMDFLWVRRYRLERSWHGRDCFKRRRLYRVQFLPHNDPNAFGFINPDEVIRASHLIPSFHSPKITTLLPIDSIGRLQREGLEEGEDWEWYCVNPFPDRDMVMRYRGCGVGHFRVNVPVEAEPAIAHEPEEVSIPEQTFTNPVVPEQPPSAVGDREEVPEVGEQDVEVEDEDHGPGNPDDDDDEDSEEEDSRMDLEDAAEGAVPIYAEAGDVPMPVEILEGYATL
ncbi:hypothetical protein MIND_00399200 [Mycena indigotica]|uniref:Uncharacterized protein n=1 Tax=Mycena indigotica TaxID=2126181 RepID=A0A8H6T3D8_9AGAR|nr:uncharacterized protein MIND_00399200 [Mycena indigotica]KAF7310253.1 hypothetical protein MIND_00399200 [Mycena indigotica]